jgi:hypothetical protein
MPVPGPALPSATTNSFPAGRLPGAAATVVQEAGTAGLCLGATHIGIGHQPAKAKKFLPGKGKRKGGIGAAISSQSGKKTVSSRICIEKPKPE